MEHWAKMGKSKQKTKSLIFNPFQANIPFLYPLTTSENQSKKKTTTGYSKGTLN